MKTVLWIGVFLFVQAVACAQIAVAGKVIDEATHEAVPFAVVVDTLSRKGTTADVDGRFSFSVSKLPCTLRILVSGYEEKFFVVNSSAPVEIPITPKTYEMGVLTVSFSTENPALRIIRNASAARDSHNPANITSYTCSNYTKTFVTVEAPADTSVHKKKKGKTGTQQKTRLDSLLDAQYLFLSESVSHIKYKKPLRQETIIASRVSGFHQPSLTLVASQLQSVSFYDDVFQLFDIEYLSPLAPSAINRYNYKLTDTLLQDGDSLFIISYWPKKGSAFNGLRGTLHISSDGYAIRDVTAEPVDNQGSITVSITQRYEKVDSTHWFPVQLITEWYNNMLVIDQGEVNFTANPDSTMQRTKLVCRSYLSDIRVDTVLSRSDFTDTELEMDTSVVSHDEKFWDQYRTEPLTKKEKNTYQKIDSVGDKINLDKRLKSMAAAMQGRQQVGPVDIDMDKLISYNYYEGIRLGLGLHTNEMISDRFRVGGYFAYGFHDRGFKYGADASLLIDKKNGLTSYFSWQHDVAEVGLTPQHLEGKIRGSESYRLLYRRNFDHVDRYDAGFRFRAMRHFQFEVFGNKQFRTATGDYRFIQQGENVATSLRAYELTEAGVAMRFAFRERYGMVLGQRLLISPTHWPLVLAEAARGIGDIEYTRAQLRINYNVPHFFFGQPEFSLLAGKVWGDVPSGLLFSGRGTYRPYFVSARNTFETMEINEFISSQYVYLFYAHKFLLHIGKRKKYKPEIVVRNSFGFGKLSNPASHSGIDYKTMEKGYYETGVEFNNVLAFGFNGYGFGIFYRYGPYAYSTPAKNLAVKFTLTFVI